MQNVRNRLQEATILLSQNKGYALVIDEEEVSQAYKRQIRSKEQYGDDVVEEPEYVHEEVEEQPDPANNTEEALAESQEIPPDVREESDDEDEEEEGGGRIRFKTERKEGTIIRLSDISRERRNIPDTLELSAEAKATLMEFEEMERQRKLGRYGPRRGGRRGGNSGMPRGMGDQRHSQNDRGHPREQRSMQGQPIRSLFQQQQQRIQPLLSMQRPQHPPSEGSSSQQEKSRPQSILGSTPPHQPKNIHINPHFKGNVASVQVPLLPVPTVPNQPRPAMGPPRFPGMPDFQHVSGPMPGNFNPPPRLQEPWRNPPPPPQPERDPFFMGEPRFHMFDQRNPPPIPPPPLLNNNLPVPNQNPPPFSPPGQGFNQPGPQQRFNQPQSNFNLPGPGQQPGFNTPGPQAGFPQPGFNQPGPQPGFNQSGPQPNFNPPGPQAGFNPPVSQPGFNQPNFNPPGPPPGFNQSAPQPPFNSPGMNQPGFNQPNPGPQPGFNQPGTGPQPNFPQPVPGPQQGFNNPGFTRERPVRINLPSPGPMGVPPFNQPATNIRHFPPPRQQFPPSPGQPFMPHNQSNMQGPMPPLQPLHQHHPPGGQQKPPMPMPPTPPFRAHSQNPQNPSHRMPGPRHLSPKQRQGTPIQNIVKGHNQQVVHPRNSNLRELPLAPSHSVDMNKRKASSTPAAHVIPVATTTPPHPKSGSAENAQAARPRNVTSTVNPEVKIEKQFPDEDEETRKYRLKIEEQKRLREEILKQKELRRQQQAGARKKELLQRLTQQQQQASSAQQNQPDADKQTLKPENSGNQSDVVTTTSPQKIPPLQTAATNVTFQGQQKKIIKQTVQNKVSESPSPKVQQVRPAMSAPSAAVKVVPVQGKLPEQRLTGTKRTVMQRSNSNSGEGAQIAPKVRVIKLSTSVENNVQEPSEHGQQQVPQQRIVAQQRPLMQQQRLQQRTGPVRKVTLGKTSVQQQQSHQQQFQVKPRSQLSDGSSPQVVTGVQGYHSPNKVIMRGRGRGVGGQMGRGRLMPSKQNLRVGECTPQTRIVTVEGLSSSTTDHQLRNLLMSVGPIEDLQMFPHQRKAIATFLNPHHALQFQQKFHRHMIDLSHINVSLVAE
uniref:RRM domain-containing protein n=1 Tax=Pyxicephalus adspersus TaxID=30357 RepID=A0AAV3AJ84_PYXAD|nr:TPA: hypothetical protein GDO54_012656 [Pyxicephalus adspersus]